MKKVSEKCRLFGIAGIVVSLLGVVIGFGIYQLKAAYASQVIHVLGMAAGHGQEVSKYHLDLIMQGYVEVDSYERGMRLLQENGYGGSAPELLGTQISWVWAAIGGAVLVSCCILLMGLTLFYKRQQRLRTALVRWCRHMENTDLEKQVEILMTRETREVIEALQEHRRMDERSRTCLEIERAKTLSFVEDISHQLKTPLTIMRMHIEKMSYSQKFSAEALKKAMVQVDKMVLLISMMMKVGMLNSGKTRMEIRKQDVSDLAEEICQEFEIICEMKDVEFETKLTGMREFWYDEYWMKEAIENVVKNCVEYSEPEGKICVYYQVGTSGMTVIVRDYGKGIEKQNIAHIFERFTCSFRQNDSSSGLGLAITKQVVEAHFGKITVENNEEKGVTFTIYIPIMKGRGVYDGQQEDEEDFSHMAEPERGPGERQEQRQ